jgi:hypothetical protein
MGSVEGRVAIQYVHPYPVYLLCFIFTSFRYVDEKDSQYVPRTLIQVDDMQLCPGITFPSNATGATKPPIRRTNPSSLP